MKLAIAALAALLALPTRSYAEPLHPPSGPVYADDLPGGDLDVDVDVRIDAPAPGPRAHMGGDRTHVRKRQLRGALLAAFDVNGDGKLGARERVRAIRVLRKIERRLEAGPAREGRARMQQRRGGR